jgi:hypothetical protein
MLSSHVHILQLSCCEVLSLVLFKSCDLSLILWKYVSKKANGDSNKVKVTVIPSKKGHIVCLIKWQSKIFIFVESGMSLR